MEPIFLNTFRQQRKMPLNFPIICQTTCGQFVNFNNSLKVYCMRTSLVFVFVVLLLLLCFAVFILFLFIYYFFAYVLNLFLFVFFFFGGGGGWGGVCEVDDCSIKTLKMYLRA